LEAQKNMNSQGNTEQKEQCWRYHNTQLQTILQRYRNKSSTVLAQKQIWTLVEQNRRPSYESTQLHPTDFWQRCPKHTMENRQPLQETLQSICMQKSETRSMFVTLYKYQLKVE
jgi:hypothetical protein